jgi:hypothetical protein
VFSLSGNFFNWVAPLDGMRGLASLSFSCYVCCRFVTLALLPSAAGQAIIFFFVGLWSARRGGAVGGAFLPFFIKRVFPISLYTYHIYKLINL